MKITDCTMLLPYVAIIWSENWEIHNQHTVADTVLQQTDLSTTQDVFEEAHELSDLQGHF